MKTIKAKNYSEAPKNFTGKIEYESGNIEYRLNGKLHRLDGPADIGYYGDIFYWIEGKLISCCEQKFYNSIKYKQWTLLENIKKFKNI